MGLSAIHDYVPDRQIVSRHCQGYLHSRVRKTAQSENMGAGSGHD